MGMMSFVISLLLFFLSGRTILSNVSHLITMITLIRGEIVFFSLSLMISLESLWRVRFFMEVGESLWGVRLFMKVGILLKMIPFLSSFSMKNLGLDIHPLKV
jgi:hypothetical protein